MDYLIRLVHVHESFRVPEIRALAENANLPLTILAYDPKTPHLLIRVADEKQATTLIQRSILSKGIYELWGQGETYEELHATVRSTASARRARYQHRSFRFEVDAYLGKRSATEQRSLIESFRYLGLEGEIKMRGAEEEFCIFEAWDGDATRLQRAYLGRLVGRSGRAAVQKYDLKKRRYISTTSMDAELALVTANLALAGPGKFFYDPFVGTGGFPIACAHLGAICIGSDIDGRSIRGKGEGKEEGRAGQGKSVLGNFVQYGLVAHWLDGFVADLTHSPVREGRWLDGIVCDPPYGVREGLKVLGSRDPVEGKETVYIDGVPAHQIPGYIPPKRPYSFEAMMEDILDFAAMMLVDGGRLSLWMPTANEEMGDLAIPLNEYLKVGRVDSSPIDDFRLQQRENTDIERLPP
ncbi:MAG: hypothetical protein M1838_003641 [Thelocarpon superellum]|nr:MAG: hypothetical protein M1838_003641 [Thelocarpon superellum]